MQLSSLGNMSPHEKLFGITNHHLRAFGCLCYTYTLKEGRTKFQPQVDPCVFLDYPYSQKAYKLYNLNTKKIIISRDDIFHEHHFPFHFKDKSPSTRFYLLVINNNHFTYYHTTFPPPPDSFPDNAPHTLHPSTPPLLITLTLTLPTTLTPTYPTPYPTFTSYFFY